MDDDRARYGRRVVLALINRLPADSCFDTIRRSFHVLVLPDPNYRPSRIAQALVGVPVSTAVRLDLRLPPVGVCLRPRCVLRASVPEAAIYEDGDPETRKHDVGPATSRVAERRTSDEEP
jgi:hypothetical protein